MKRVISVVVVAIVIAVSTYLYIITPSKRFKEFDKKNIIIYEGEIITDESPLFYNEKIYLPYAFIKKQIDEDIFIDFDHLLVTSVFGNKLIHIDKKSVEIKGEEAYIDSKTIEEIYPVKISLLDTGIIVHDDRIDTAFVIAGKETYIRYDKNIKSPYSEISQPSDMLYVIDDSDKEWIKIYTGSGNMGYIDSDEVSEIKIRERTYINEERPRIILKDKNIFAWEMMYSIPEETRAIDNYSGIDIISPTLIELKNKEGDIVTRIPKEHIKNLKDKGIYIVPCVTNKFDDPKMTSEFLKDPDARNRFITNLIKSCLDNGFDGLNIDFENIDYRNREDLTQLIRELSYFTHLNDIMLSVCTGVMYGSLNYSLVYDHKKIGEFADYLMLMSYDELNATGDTYGPVASLSWQETKIREVLELVDNTKLYIGVPLYTRVWNINDQNKYKSIPVSIRRQKEILEENITGVFEQDEDSGQMMFRYFKDETNYIMYIEDVDMVKRRIGLAEKYGTAGTAFWAANYVDGEFFGEIEKKSGG